MDRVVLQVPMPKVLKQEAEAVASDLGFSSLQEIIRVILRKIAKRELKVAVYEEEEVRLSPKAERRYAKMDEDFRTGKNIYMAKDIGDLLRQLRPSKSK